MELKGATAIITGSSRGIGKAIALALANQGVSVAAVARNLKGRGGAEGSLEATVGEIRALGGRAEAIVADVSKEKDVDALVQETLKKFGKIDILVNNAGAFPNLSLHLVDLPVESFDLIFNVNLRGAFLCIKKTLPFMIQNRKGSIINITSILATRAPKGRVAYSASKAGLDRLTYGLAEEVKEFNIAVNLLCPIYLTDTPGAREQYPNGNVNEWVKPEDVAGVAVWLTRQEASKYTGRGFTVPARDKLSAIIYGKMSEESIWIPVE